MSEYLLRLWADQNDDLSGEDKELLRQTANQLEKLGETLVDARARIKELENATTVQGWKQVPEYPSNTMLAAGLYHSSHDTDVASLSHAFTAMVRAAEVEDAKPSNEGSLNKDFQWEGCVLSYRGKIIGSYGGNYVQFLGSIVARPESEEAAELKLIEIAKEWLTPSTDADNTALRDAAHDAVIALKALLEKPEDESRRPHAQHYLERLNTALALENSRTSVRSVPAVEDIQKYRDNRSDNWCRAFDALNDYRLTNIIDQDGHPYGLVDLMTRDGVQITDGEMELVDMTDAIFQAIGAYAGKSVFDHPLATHGSPSVAPIGLYRVHWKSGGSSLAAIGQMHDGNRWIAPTNWLSPGMRPTSDTWGKIERLEPISPAETTDMDALARAMAKEVPHG